MTRYVIDASVAVEYLLKTPLGLSVANLIESDSQIAPELLDAEVLSVLRRAVLGGHLKEDRALLAINVLQHWPVHRIAHRTLARMAWEHRRNVSAYDAFYVARCTPSQCSRSDGGRTAIEGDRSRCRGAERPDGMTPPSEHAWSFLLTYRSGAAYICPPFGQSAHGASAHSAFLPALSRQPDSPQAPGVGRISHRSCPPGL